MPRGQKNFEIIIQEAKKLMSEHNISFDEIEKNTDVEAEFIRILFDPATGTSKNISKIFDFLKIKMYSKHLMFMPYQLVENDGQFRIKRNIKPVCTMYYDRSKDEFFKFRYRLKTEVPSQSYTDIIKMEMRDFLYKNLNLRK